MYQLKLSLYILLTLSLLQDVNASNNNNDAPKKWSVIKNGKTVDPEKLERQERERQQKLAASKTEWNDKVLTHFPTDGPLVEKRKVVIELLSGKSDEFNKEAYKILNCVTTDKKFPALNEFVEIFNHTAEKCVPRFSRMLKTYKDKSQIYPLLTLLSNYAKRNIDKPSAAHMINLLKLLMAKPRNLKRDAICESLLGIKQTSNAGNVVFVACSFPENIRRLAFEKIMDSGFTYTRNATGVVMDALDKIKTESGKLACLGLLKLEEFQSRYQRLPEIVESLSKIFHSGLDDFLIRVKNKEEGTRCLLELIDACEEVLNVQDKKELLEYYLHQRSNQIAGLACIHSLFRKNDLRIPFNEILKIVRLSDREKNIIPVIGDAIKNKTFRPSSFFILPSLLNGLSPRNQREDDINLKDFVEGISVIVEEDTDKSRRLEQFIGPVDRLAERLVYASYVYSPANTKRNLEKREHLKRLAAYEPIKLAEFMFKMKPAQKLDEWMLIWEKLGPFMAKSSDIMRVISSVGANYDPETGLKVINLFHDFIRNLEMEQVNDNGGPSRILSLFKLLGQRDEDQLQVAQDMCPGIVAKLTPATTLEQRYLIAECLCRKNISNEEKEKIIDSILNLSGEEVKRASHDVFAALLGRYEEIGSIELFLEMMTDFMFDTASIKMPSNQLRVIVGKPNIKRVHRLYVSLLKTDSERVLMELGLNINYVVNLIHKYSDKGENFKGAPAVIDHYISPEFMGQYDFGERVEVLKLLSSMKEVALGADEFIQSYIKQTDYMRGCYREIAEGLFDPATIVPVLPAIENLSFTTYREQSGIVRFIRTLMKLHQEGKDTLGLVNRVTVVNEHLSDILNCLAILPEEEAQLSEDLQKIVMFIVQKCNRVLSEVIPYCLAICEDRATLVDSFMRLVTEPRKFDIGLKEDMQSWKRAFKAYIALPPHLRVQALGEDRVFHTTNLSDLEKVSVVSYWSEQLKSKNRERSNFFATVVLDDHKKFGLTPEDALFVEALSLKTVYLNEDLDSFDIDRATIAANYVLGHMRLLGLNDGNDDNAMPDFLVEKARWVGHAVQQPNDTRNPYYLHEYFRAKRAQVFDFSYLKPAVDDSIVACQFNPAGVAGIKLDEVKVKDLPKYDPEFLVKMTKHLRQRVDGKEAGLTEEAEKLEAHVVQLTEASIGHVNSLSSLLKNCEPQGILSRMLYSPGGYEGTVPTTTAKFICIISYLQQLSDQRAIADGKLELLSPQEEMFLKLLSIIPYCEIRKVEGINTFYRLLPEEARLKNLIAHNDSRDAVIRAWVYPVVVKHIDDHFYSSHPFVVEMCGTELTQGVHCVNYLRNMLGGVLPLGTLEFDSYTAFHSNLSSALTDRSYYEVVEGFYRHLSISPLIKNVKARMNQALATEKSGAFDAIERLFSDNVDRELAWDITKDPTEINDYGVVHLLVTLDLLRLAAK